MTNLFPNPSVEANIDGFFFDWGTAAGVQSSDWAKDGTSSLKMTTSDGGWNYYSIPGIVVDTEYTFSLYAKGSGSLKLSWRAQDTDTAQLDTEAYNTPVTLSDTPVQITHTFTPTNPATVYVKLLAYNTTAGPVVWYTDWHQLEVGAVATPYPSSGVSRIHTQFQLRPY